MIPKAVRPDHLAANLAAQELNLDGEALAQLARADRGLRRVEGGLWLLPGSPYTPDNLWDGPPR